MRKLLLTGYYRGQTGAEDKERSLKTWYEKGAGIEIGIGADFKTSKFTVGCQWPMLPSGGLQQSLRTKTKGYKNILCKPNPEETGEWPPLTEVGWY